MEKINKILFVLYILLTSSVYSNPDQLELNKILDNKNFTNASISIYAKNLNTQKVILDKNSKMSLNPASVIKLILCATSLEVLKPDYKFKTRVYYTGKITEGILEGDLIIKSGNDPVFFLKNFTNHYENFFKRLIKSISTKGIKKINGKIKVQFEKLIPESWTWGNLNKYYGTPPSTFVYHDNHLNILLKSNKDQIKIINCQPNPPFKIINQIQLKKRTDLNYSYKTNNIIIKGLIMPQQIKMYKIPNLFPNLVFIKDIKKELLKAKIEIHQKENNLKHEKKDIMLLNFVSPSLDIICKEMISTSNNLIAESILSQISKYYTDNFFDSNRKNTINWFWNKMGKDTTGMKIYDGCGLSRKNALSSKNIVDILEYMYINSKYWKQYYHILDNKGSFGAFGQTYFKDKYLNKNIFGKAGSLSNLNSFGGYIKNPKGEFIVFSIIIQNHHYKKRNEILNTIEQIIKILV